MDEEYVDDEFELDNEIIDSQDSSSSEFDKQEVFALPRQRVFIFPKEIVDKVFANQIENAILCTFPHPITGNYNDL